jgi:uncharacterized lipoprotein
MKNFAMIILAGAVLSLAACSTTQNDGGAQEDYVESSAPYAPERSAGDRVFSSSQRK